MNLLEVERSWPACLWCSFTVHRGAGMPGWGMSQQLNPSLCMAPALWPDPLRASCFSPLNGYTSQIVCFLCCCCFFVLGPENTQNWTGLENRSLVSWGIPVRFSRVSGHAGSRSQCCGEPKPVSPWHSSFSCCVTVILSPCWLASSQVSAPTQGTHRPQQLPHFKELPPMTPTPRATEVKNK